MAVQLVCPNLRCRKFLSVPDDVRGKLVKCSHCQQMLRVPTPRPPEPLSPDKKPPTAAAEHS
jgi:hypothetical protein